MRRMFLLFSLLWFLTACAVTQVPVTQVEEEQPDIPVGPNLEDKARFHRFHDGGILCETLLLDLRTQGLISWLELETPLRRSLAYAKSKPATSYAASAGGITLTWQQVTASLEKMLGLLPRLDYNPYLLSKYFTWYELQPEPLMSGYYTPEIEVSFNKTFEYSVPIYALPQDLSQKKDGKGVQCPYYTRAEIDLEGVLQNRGLEIAWAKSAFEVFNLQVQGAGLARFPDGSTRSLVYAGKNGHAFKGLGAILRDEGILPVRKLSVPYIRAFCQDHPQQARQLMAKNKSYVFFKFGQEGAQGSIEQALSPMISLATDPQVLPLGAMLIMNATIPSPENGMFQTVRGLGLAQDTGTAIKGARLDYYIGEGERAGNIARRIWNKVRV